MQASLFKRYEELFDIFVCSGTAVPHAMRIKCGDGWFAIIDVLSGVLWELDRAIRVENIQAVNRQLSYIVSNGDNLGEMGAIVAAQLLSERICEETGLPTGDYAIRYKERKQVTREATYNLLSVVSSRRYSSTRNGEHGSRPLSPTPREVGDHLRHKHGLRSDAQVDLPVVYFDLADCSISAIKHFLNPGRFDLARLSCPQLLSFTWQATIGFEMKVSDRASVSAALKAVEYRSAVGSVDDADRSPVLLENRIRSNIGQVKIFADRMALRINPSNGSTLPQSKYGE